MVILSPLSNFSMNINQVAKRSSFNPVRQMILLLSFVPDRLPAVRHHINSYPLTYHYGNHYFDCQIFYKYKANGDGVMLVRKSNHVRKIQKQKIKK